MRTQCLPFVGSTRRRDPRAVKRRTDGAHRGLLAAVVALAFGAWLVVVQHEAPELDASTARETLVVLDELLAGDGSERR